MRKQQDFAINPFHNNYITNEKNLMASDNKILKCLDCDEILIVNWLNESEKILACSNNQCLFPLNNTNMKIFILKADKINEELTKVKEFLEDTRNQTKVYEQELTGNNCNNLIDSFQMNEVEFYNLSSDQDLFSH